MASLYDTDDHTKLAVIDLRVPWDVQHLRIIRTNTHSPHWLMHTPSIVPPTRPCMAVHIANTPAAGVFVWGFE